MVTDMRKLIVFSIFIFFTLIFSRTLLVPEEFLNIQQAVVVAQNGDTVSVNFGRSNGQRVTVTTSRIFSKEITFEISGEEKEKLLEMINEANNLTTADIDSGWTGQRMVNRPDKISDVGPHLAIDNSDRPWVVWDGPESLVGGKSIDINYAKWNGESWNEEQGVSPWDSLNRFRPAISLDNGSIPWVVWNRTITGHEGDIFFTRWNGKGWEPERQVNLLDSTELDFAPHIAYGGGQTWIVWYGGPTDISPYTVYASRWNGNGWEPDMQVSPSDNCHHWFCDVAVDNNGMPHVVWCEVPHYRLYYSYFNGVRWTDPIIINDTTEVWASPWADPHIRIDCQRNLHVAWTGAFVGASYRDIFYDKYDGTGWSPSFKISQDSCYHEWYSDIAADRPDNIWVVWDRQGEGQDEFRIYASHYNGTSWSTEERLDNDSSYRDGGPRICLDNNGEPWVVWDGKTYSLSYDIYYNRFVSAGIKAPSISKCPVSWAYAYPHLFSKKITFFLKPSFADHVLLRIYDSNGKAIKTLVNKRLTPNTYRFFWDGRDENGAKVHSGIYFIYVKMDNKEEIEKVVFIKK